VNRIKMDSLSFAKLWSAERIGLERMLRTGSSVPFTIIGGYFTG
jgi:hypothetical protein